MALEVIDFRSKRLKNSSKKIPPLKAIEVAKEKCFSCYCYKMDETRN